MLTPTATGVRLTLRVQPRAARSRVVGRHGDALKVQVTAPPVDGAANAAVIDVIAAWLGVPRRCVSIAQGQSGRDKVVEVSADDAAGLAARIARLLGDESGEGVR